MLDSELKMFIASEDVNPFSRFKTASDWQVKQDRCVLGLGKLCLQELLQMFLMDREPRQVDQPDSLGIDVLDANHFADDELYRDADKIFSKTPQFLAIILISNWN